MAKRSPFPRKSLPQAGESLRDAMHDLFFDKFLFWFIVALMMALVAVVELIGKWCGRPIPPSLWGFLAMIYGIVALWRWISIKPQMHNLHQGMRGEREVGRMLEDLRSMGYAVFHDIPGNNFNIDHALIGPGGIFAIETKTFSKPEGRKGKVVYDGQRVLVDGHAPDRDPVAQAAAVADHLRDILKGMTNREVSVRPVVLFPTWWVDPQPRGVKVWVLNSERFMSFVRNEPDKLSREDIALFTNRLMLHLSPPP